MLIYGAIPELPSSAVALGFFDGLHPGHEAVIRAAAKGGERTVVLSIGDSKRKASRLLTDEDRNFLLESMGADMLVIPDFSDIQNMSGEEFFKSILVGRLHARRVVCGYNFHFGHHAACNADDLAAFCAAEGVECVVIPQVRVGEEDVSSRLLRLRLDDGDVAGYASLCGRRFSYRVEVMSGHKLGRKLGFPTVNQQLPDYFRLPRYGVYASVVRTPDGIVRPAVTNIGVRPTVGSPVPLSETWIMDYSSDIYGREVRVELVEFIRPERKFQSLEELKRSIADDASRAEILTGSVVSTDLP